jgi:hypothetical protein
MRSSSPSTTARHAVLLAAVAAIVALAPSAPNPFGAATRIRFSTARPADVRLRIVDVAGRDVVTLVDARFGPGGHSVRWDGRDAAGRAVPAGVHVQVLAADGARLARRVVRVY